MQVRYVKIGEFGQISRRNSKTSHVYHTERHDTIRYDKLYLRAPKSWGIASLAAARNQKNEKE